MVSEITRNLTEENKKESNRLKAIWQSKQKELELTQVEAAERLRTTQGFVGQCLNGHVALSTNMILRWAALLEFDPEQIRKGVFQGVDVSTPTQIPVIFSTDGTLRTPITLEEGLVAIHVENNTLFPRVVKGENVIAKKSPTKEGEEVIIRTHDNTLTLGFLKSKQKTQVKINTPTKELTIKDIDIDFMYPVKGILK